MAIASIFMALALALGQAEPAPAPVAAPSPSESQPAPSRAADGSTTVTEVVIQATSAHVVDTFVNAIAAAPPQGRLARWDRSVCSGVIGLQRDSAQILNDRIAAAASALHLRVGDPGCRPNILVLVMNDSATVVPRLVAAHPRAFGMNELGATEGRAALDTFIASSAPVRWWHVNGLVNDNGQRILTEADNFDPPSVATHTASRLHSGTREDFSHVVIVVDAARTGPINLALLGDYVAMVSLAQVRADVDSTGVPSILNLFADRAAGRAPVGGLTEWDIGYLRGLYDAQRYAMNSRRQQQQIARSIRHRQPEH